MSLGTFDRTPPPIFRQGPSALTKLMVFSALSLFLMVADSRFHVAQPVRMGLAAVLVPLQWVALQPVLAFRHGAGYFTSLQQAQANEEASAQQLALQSIRASQVEQLSQENTRLRLLLALGEQPGAQGTAAEVLYDAADPYSRKIVIAKGLTHGVAEGSPVMDELGVLGQVTRVLPLVSEVRLVIDRDQAIPVLNVRSGERSVAYGDPSSGGDGMELRFMGSNADLQVGDLLTTSGVDGVYPPGLPVAKITRIERRAESAFAKVYCAPQALVRATRHVMVITPVASQLPAWPEARVPDAPPRKLGRKP